MPAYSIIRTYTHQIYIYAYKGELNIGAESGVVEECLDHYDERRGHDFCQLEE